MRRLIRDMGYALRGMGRHRLLTAVAIFALALGSGMTSALFTIVNAWLLRPLPFAEVDRLVLIWEDDVEAPQRYGYSSNALYEELRQTSQSFETLATFRSTGRTPTALKIPSPLVRQVTASYFPLLGVEPMLGRTFLPEEDVPGGPARVILSHNFWQRHLGADPDIVGKVLELDYVPHEVVGVMDATYRSPIEREPPQLWIPLALDLDTLDPSDRRYLIFGRLAQGITLAQARSELDQVTAEMRRRHPESHMGRAVASESIHEVLVSELRTSLGMLFAAVVFVLLIACCNVANLLMARILSRGPEMAIRRTLGAGRRTILRQLLVENMLLALVGVALGLAFSVVILRLLPAMIPPEPGMPWFGLVRIDGTVVAFALGVAALIGSIFALVQASEISSGRDLHSISRQAAGRTTADRGLGRARGLLVVIETAVSLALVIAAGLLWQSFRNTQAIDPGFETQNILTLRTALHGENFTTGAERTAHFDLAVDTLRALPGVEAAAVTSRPPPSAPLAKIDFTIQGNDAPEPGFEPKALQFTVTPGFFDTLRIPLRRGRPLDGRDRQDTQPTVVISELVAQRYFNGEDPMDRLIRLDDGTDTLRRIVGVVGDVRTVGVPPDPVPTLYLPHAQKPEGVMSYVVRTRDPPERLAPEIVRQVASLDPLMPIYRVTTVEDTLAQVDWQPRFSVRLLGLFAAVALFLAGAGIYGIMAFMVAERQKELGIRVALGASALAIFRVATRDGLRLTGVGIALGLMVSFALTRFLGAQLHGVSPTDPTTFAVLSAGVAAVAAVACGLAAWRALRIDPALVIRQD